MSDFNDGSASPVHSEDLGVARVSPLFPKEGSRVMKQYRIVRSYYGTLLSAPICSSLLENASLQIAVAADSKCVLPCQLK